MSVRSRTYGPYYSEIVPQEAPPTPSLEAELLTRVRAFLQRVFGREEEPATRHDRASVPADEEKQFVSSGVDALPDSWRDL
jgi:hypothetical protein